MPTVLAVTFPWGRYHATPWGTHVNEGGVEWPPAPWRLLRALYATWKNRLPNVPDQDMRALLGALVEPPSFVLPPMRPAHTRHYYPDEKSGTDLTVDSFAAFERGGAILVEWPVDLGPAQRELLASLATELPYLGRAESICQAVLLDDGEVPGWAQRLSPIAGGVGAASVVRVLGAAAPLQWASLEERPVELRRRRFTTPAGARWLQYPKVEAAEVVRAALPRLAPTHEAVRWSVASSAKPAITAAVAMGHVARRATLRSAGDRARILAGKDADGERLAGHGHAHYLSLDEDGDGLVDALVVWAPGGLGPDEVAALVRVDRLTGHGHIPDFRPTRLGFEGVGHVGDLVPSLAGPSRVWRTRTPFAPGFVERSRSRRGGDRWEAVVRRQVRKELAARRFPAPSGVEVLTEGVRPALEFRRHRPDRQTLSEGFRAAHVEVVFDDLVKGPIVLGALSHFGLGCFVAVR